MKGNDVVYLSMKSAAERLGCSPPTVRRVAKSKGIGIMADGTTLVAVAVQDLALLKPHIHETSGNPVWIAAGKAKRRRKKPA